MSFSSQGWAEDFGQGWTNVLALLPGCLFNVFDRLIELGFSFPLNQPNCHSVLSDISSTRSPIFQSIWNLFGNVHSIWWLLHDLCPCWAHLQGSKNSGLFLSTSKKASDFLLHKRLPPRRTWKYFWMFLSRWRLVQRHYLWKGELSVQPCDRSVPISWGPRQEVQFDKSTVLPQCLSTLPTGRDSLHPRWPIERNLLRLWWRLPCLPHHFPKIHRWRWEYFGLMTWHLWSSEDFQRGQYAGLCTKHRETVWSFPSPSQRSWNKTSSSLFRGKNPKQNSTTHATLGLLEASWTVCVGFHRVSLEFSPVFLPCFSIPIFHSGAPQDPWWLPARQMRSWRAVLSVPSSCGPNPTGVGKMMLWHLPPMRSPRERTTQNHQSKLQSESEGSGSASATMLCLSYWIQKLLQWPQTSGCLE